MSTLNDCQGAVLCIDITCLKFHADISYRLKDISILDNHESRKRAATFIPAQFVTQFPELWRLNASRKRSDSD